jgi:hypothetical protein
MTTLTPDVSLPETDDEQIVVERVRAAAELLEAIDADRGLLAQVSAEDRERLLRATRVVSDPDPRSRRRLVKAHRRQRKATLAQQDTATSASSTTPSSTTSTTSSAPVRRLQLRASAPSSPTCAAASRCSPAAA